MHIALCLLTLNELEGCKHDVPLIDREKFHSVYCVDGGSSDGTVEFLKSHNIPVYQQPKPGLNAAHVHAVNKCDADALVIFHPKGSIPVSDTLKFKNYFESGHELVIASRNIKGGKNEEDRTWFKPRKWLSMMLAFTTALIWKREGNMIWDVLHGFRGITVKAFRKIDPVNYGLSIDIELVIRSYKKKIKRIEFPTSERDRIAGTTHFRMLPTGKKILIYLFKEMFRA